MEYGRPTICHCTNSHTSINISFLDCNIRRSGIYCTVLALRMHYTVKIVMPNNYKADNEKLALRLRVICACAWPRILANM